MASRPRCDPAAQGRKLKALRIVTQGEAVWAQLVFQRRSVDPTLDAGRAGHVVDLQHLVQTFQVNSYDAVVPVRRLEPSHRGAAAAEWDGSVTGRRAPLQHGFNFLFVAGAGDNVGGVWEVEIESPDAVPEAAPVGVYRPVVVVADADASQGRRRRDAGFAQRNVRWSGR